MPVCTSVSPSTRPACTQPRIHTVRLNVLEAPSPPQCAMRGEEQLGATMLLTCNSSSGNPEPTYNWWKVESSGNQILNSSHTSPGTLLIQTLSVDSPGVYLCIASNVLASESCSMALTLEISQESAGGMAAGIGITLAMAVIILTLFGLGLWLHSKGAGQRPGRRAAAAQATSPHQPWQPDRERFPHSSGRISLNSSLHWLFPGCPGHREIRVDKPHGRLESGNEPE
ncbi:V-set and immunoglobulin domain-containing protein 2-like [Leucoraja erinacea]|uniref:V-set and immunoglobulin domain-containing protein 2-like n=1 Tax=Leucoraja erinaceus TaxID=7782 RepID=UPI002454B574|nr:V-set and immunoglobulin domain-containing protein 2-like [Leucoraja erinacea]